MDILVHSASTPQVPLATLRHDPSIRVPRLPTHESSTGRTLKPTNTPGSHTIRPRFPPSSAGHLAQLRQVVLSSCGPSRIDFGQDHVSDAARSQNTITTRLTLKFVLFSPWVTVCALEKRFRGDYCMRYSALPRLPNGLLPFFLSRLVGVVFVLVNRQQASNMCLVGTRRTSRPAPNNETRSTSGRTSYARRCCARTEPHGFFNFDFTATAPFEFFSNHHQGPQTRMSLKSTASYGPR